MAVIILFLLVASFSNDHIMFKLDYNRAGAVAGTTVFMSQSGKIVLFSGMDYEDKWIKGRGGG